MPFASRKFVNNADSTLRNRLHKLRQLLFHIRLDGFSCTSDQLSQLRAEEIDAQLKAIRREVPVRLTVMALLAAVFLLYLPAAFVLIWAVAVLVCDGLEDGFFRRARAGPDQTHFYKVGLLAVYVGELCTSLPSSIIWQTEDPFSKAISVGVMSAALMRLTTIRSIHPATGLAGTAAVATLIAVFNSYYWLHLGDIAGFVFTSIIGVTSIGHVIAAIIQHHGELRQAAIGKLALQQASEAKSHFLSQMSHELRTPLNAIIGIGTSAHLSTQDPQLKDNLDVLVTSAKGLSVVLDDVLDMSAIEQGRITLRARNADIRQEIGLAVALFRPQAEAAGLDLRTEFADDLPKFALLDFDRLRQCILNLASNAVKHTNTGHVVVRVSDDPVGLLRIEVEDTGRGIPPGFEEAIFNRYERALNDAPGYGLGLTICRTIARHMGGEVVAVQVPKGATFRMWCPFEVTPGLMPLGPESLAGADVSGRTVLIVDDIPTNRMVAATYLGILRATPIEAASGTEAVAILQSNPDIDLILLDINMPQMDGIETLRSIRALQWNGKVPPIIAMTADASERDRLIYLKAGMDGYVSKPIDINRLNAEILRVFANV